MDFDGMKTSILEMLSDAAIPVNTSTFRNDAVNFQNRNDVLTYLMHLGYLGYDPNRQTAFVPNEEIRQELVFSGREHPLELKWNHNARTALQQIRERNYPESILNYTEEILLVDINYDPKNKVHECRIEKYENEKRLYIQLCSRLQPPPNGCRRLHSCSVYFFYTVILSY